MSRRYQNRAILTLTLVCMYCLWWLGGTIIAGYMFLKERSKIALLFLFLLFGVFGYILNVPHYVDMDLMRLYNAYDNIKEYSFSEALPLILSVGDFSYSLFWVLGQLDIPTRFIGFLSSAWFYGAWFIVILLIENKQTTKMSFNFLFAITLIFLTVTHPFFFSGIRSATGTMLSVIGSVKLMQSDCRKGWWWLLSACFFHFSFLIYLLFCILFKLVRNHFFKVTSIILLAGAPIYFFLIDFLFDYLSSFGILGEVLSGKIYAYNVSDEHQRSNLILTYGSGFRFIDNVFIFLLCTIYRYIPAYRAKIKSNGELYNFDKFLTLFFCSCVFISPNAVMLGRYINLLIYLNLAFLAYTYYYLPKPFLSKLVNAIAIVSLFLSIIAVYRESIGLDAIYYIYYPRVLYEGWFSLSNIYIDYVK